MGHSKGNLLVAQLAIRHAPVILFPGRFIGVLIEVLRADMMMLAHNHPAKAG
jgi:hypothetical protein